jgi:hypothetical protein
MHLFRLIIQSILYYKWQYLALFAGILLSTAIITGALVTGDSVKLSLEKHVGLRLGNTGFAMETGGRWFNGHLAAVLSQRTGLQTAALIRKEGSASNPGSGSRVGKVMVLGVDDGFFQLMGSTFNAPAAGEAIISENLSRQLGLQPGDDLIVRMESSGMIPPDLPFAPENYLPVSIRLKVNAVAGTNDAGRFSLRSNQVASFNVFVNRQMLAQRIDLEDRANVLLIENSKSYNADTLNSVLSQSFTLMDTGISINHFQDEDFVELTSSRIFVDPVVADQAMATMPSAVPVFTYLINAIEFGAQSTPYSFVTATAMPVLSQPLSPDEVIINSWLANDLNATTGDTLLLKYFVQGPRKKLVEKSARFVVADVIEVEKSASLQALMPQIPGLSDAGSCSEWETGVPVDLNAIRDKDEEYWDEYRGTPKAYIAYETGKSLWANEFGSLTGIRFFGSEASSDEIRKSILSEISPEQLGFKILDVKNEGLRAARSGVDFGELFLSLSFFVILAGLLLTAMLFQLQTLSRNSENMVFTTLGFSKSYILRLRVTEAIPVLILGSVGGALTGIFYTKVLMAGMNTVWQDIVQNTMLWIFVKPQTIAVGTLSGIVAALTVIYFVTAKSLRHWASAQTQYHGLNHKPGKRHLNISHFIAIATVAAAITILGLAFFKSGFQNTTDTLLAGGLLLIGMLALLSIALKAIGTKNHSGPMTISVLALKNAGRNKNRSIATIALLALGVFTIIVTGANRQTFYGSQMERSSGTGGFLLWVETAVPLLYDLNTTEGLAKYALDEEPALAEAAFFQMNNLPGDDASCLNLNQVNHPGILGVDATVLHKRGSFSFAGLMKNVDPESPWQALNKQRKDAIIPAYADQTVITWGLMKKVGDTLRYLNEAGEEINLLLMGGLQNSIFQGNILIADTHFREHFPTSGGSQVMLIDAPVEESKEITSLLNTRLADLGVEISGANERLAGFNAVTNTYLSVFMILGGLGIIIGTIGLAIVVLRNIRERKSEIALLMVLGFRRKQITHLIFTENMLLLCAGIFAGAIAASVAVLPSFISAAYAINVGTILWILTAIALSGAAWVFFTVKLNISRQLIEALRNE